MKISVLVAVYNTEKYLSKCLDSLICQTHKDLQIICIDDASTDNSYRILQQYAERDCRVVVLHHTTNKGISVARNEGLKIADGDYVTMLDSDDWLASDALEKACRVAMENDENDCILMDVCHHDESDGHEWWFDYRTDAREWSGEEAFRLSLDWSIHGLYMVRNAIHKSYPYDTFCRLYSDENTTRLHYLHSRRVVRCDGVYYYRQHRGSMTHSITPLRFLFLDANYSMFQMLISEGVSDKIINQYEECRWLNVVGMYAFYWSNKDYFTLEERRDIVLKLRYFHSTIQTHRLPLRLRCKFGYIPSPSYPRLFECQSRLYLFIRKLFYKILSKPLPSYT